jgi:hypothetical protein
MTPPLEQRSFGEVGGGGVVAKERSEAWRGGEGGGIWAGKGMCCLKHLLSRKKFTGPLHLILPTFLP